MKIFKPTIVATVVFIGLVVGTLALADVEWSRSGFASNAKPLPVDYPQINTPRSQQKTCAATATQLDSMVCVDSMVIKELAGQSERCFIGGSGVTTAAGFELNTAGISQRVANANTLYCISATGNCALTAYCGDVS